jgi:Fe2+ or Zn2+ uptake regulation protein
MRQTPQREGILQVLRDSDRPLTVEEIWERMPERRSGLPTVYRNLERFVHEGWAESILGTDQVMRFVRCDSRRHHHHLQCERCGRTAEVEACGLDDSLRNLESISGFRITRHQLLLFGLCGTCRAEAAAGAKGHRSKTGLKGGPYEVGHEAATGAEGRRSKIGPKGGPQEVGRKIDR